MFFLLLLSTQASTNEISFKKAKETGETTEITWEVRDNTLYDNR